MKCLSLSLFLKIDPNSLWSRWCRQNTTSIKMYGFSQAKDHQGFYSVLIGYTSLRDGRALTTYITIIHDPICMYIFNKCCWLFFPVTTVSIRTDEVRSRRSLAILIEYSRVLLDAFYQVPIVAVLSTSFKLSRAQFPKFLIVDLNCSGSDIPQGWWWGIPNVL